MTLLNTIVITLKLHHKVVGFFVSHFIPVLHFLVSAIMYVLTKNDSELLPSNEDIPILFGDCVTIVVPKWGHSLCFYQDMLLFSIYLYFYLIYT